LFITIPFIVLTVDGAVIAPVVFNVPFIVTLPFPSDIRSGLTVPYPIFELLSSTPPISPEPLTSSVNEGDVVPIPSLDVD